MYPKLKIELNNDRLQALNIIWQMLTPEVKKAAINEDQKVSLEIILMLQEKFQKKEVDRQFRDGDYYVKLHYYQAAYFVRFLDQALSFYSYEAFPYEWNVIHTICNNLKRKL